MDRKSECPQSKRVTLRLTPFQARKLWEMRTEGRSGKKPRTVTEVMTRVLRPTAEKVESFVEESKAVMTGVTEEKLEGTGE